MNSDYDNPKPSAPGACLLPLTPHPGPVFSHPNYHHCSKLPHLSRTGAEQTHRCSLLVPSLLDARFIADSWHPAVLILLWSAASGSRMLLADFMGNLSVLNIVSPANVIPAV